MSPQERASARRQLDKRLNTLRKNSGHLIRPQLGWIKAIREALGMTAAQLAKRMGVSQPRITAIEKGETKGSITLASLERAARALDCQLVYSLRPRNTLESLVTERAEKLARLRIESTRHNMVLEAQQIDAADEDEQFKRLVQRLIDKAGSELWQE